MLSSNSSWLTSFADNPKGKQAYVETVQEYEDVAHASTDEILNKHGNPFKLNSRNVGPQFEEAIKHSMGGIPSPPPFEPLSPEQPKGPLFTHEKQQNATFMNAPRAAPETVDMNTNPDALAIKANIGILMYQEKQVMANIKRLDMLSEQVDKHPIEFAKAVLAGDIKVGNKTAEAVAQWLPEYVKNGRFETQKKAMDKEELERQVEEWFALEKMMKNGDKMTEEQKRKLAWYEKNDAESVELEEFNRMHNAGEECTDEQKARFAYLKSKGHEGIKFESLPEPVVVSKTPAINWAQYGVVGDSFDAVHANVLKTFGCDRKPEEIATDGSIKGNYGLSDARYMDREALMAQAQEEEKEAAAKRRKH